MSNSNVMRIYGISRSATANIPSIICQTFTNVERIELTNARVERIGENSFNDCKNLSHLNLNDNIISSLHEKSFSENSNLWELQISNNLITDIPEDFFANQRRLNFLLMHNNLISDFSDDTFKTLTNLRELRIDFNQLSRLKHSWFLTLGNLQTLGISGNPIDELPTNILSQLRNLIIFFAGSMNLKVISSESFGLMPNLQVLHFQGNQINAFDEEVIDNTKVIALNMTGNICNSQYMLDVSESRHAIRIAMRTCFLNYRNLAGKCLLDGNLSLM